MGSTSLTVLVVEALRLQTLAREAALKALYQYDLVAGRTLRDLLAFCAQSARPQAAELARQIVAGCIEHREELDDIIRRTAENWDIERMATADRNILRIGVYELLHRPETPPKVAINEAIELSKKYSTENSPTFVNGILDRIYATQVLPYLADGSAGVPPDPMARCDLHVHSTASDGTVDPAELPAMAAKAGLAAMALTDHDSVQGVAAARDAAEALGIELISGVELTAYAPAADGPAQVELHVAGLFVDHTSPDLLARLSRLRRSRVERVEQMARKLAEMGMRLDAEAVLARSQGGAVGRLHVAQEMVTRGYCADIGEAFDRHIGLGRPGYVPKEEMSPAEALELLHAAGGCGTLCHAGSIGDIDDRLPGLVEQGLDALEVHCPAHRPQDEKRLMDLAREHGLLVTGGSDFHGAVRPDVRLGQEAVSGVELDQLRRRAAARV